VQGSGGGRRDALEDAPAGAREHGDANRHGDKGHESGAADGIVRVEHSEPRATLVAFACLWVGTMGSCRNDLDGQRTGQRRSAARGGACQTKR
jgi:hypothetical protein